MCSRGGHRPADDKAKLSKTSWKIGRLSKVDNPSPSPPRQRLEGRYSFTSPPTTSGRSTFLHRTSYCAPKSYCAPTATADPPRWRRPSRPFIPHKRKTPVPHQRSLHGCEPPGYNRSPKTTSARRRSNSNAQTTSSATKTTSSAAPAGSCSTREAALPPFCLRSERPFAPSTLSWPAALDLCSTVALSTRAIKIRKSEKRLPQSTDGGRCIAKRLSRFRRLHKLACCEGPSSSERHEESTRRRAVARAFKVTRPHAVARALGQERDHQDRPRHQEACCSSSSKTLQSLARQQSLGAPAVARCARRRSVRPPPSLRPSLRPSPSLGATPRRSGRPPLVRTICQTLRPHPPILGSENSAKLGTITREF